MASTFQLTTLSLPQIFHSPKPYTLTPSPRRRISATTTTATTHITSPPPNIATLISHRANLLRLSLRYNDPALAKAVHAFLVKLPQGNAFNANNNTQLADYLISVYVKLGLLDDAYKVFDGLSSPNVVNYTALISGFAKAGRVDEAVRVFCRMWEGEGGVVPNGYSFVAVLSACARSLDMELGLQLHGLVVKMGYLDGCVFVGNALMGLYVKCGCLEEVVKLFDRMADRDVASWNTVMAGLAKGMYYEKVEEIFRDMSEVDHITVSTVLSACAGSGSLVKGQQVHAYALKVGLLDHLSVGNALIGFYTKCGDVEDVEALFGEMSVRDVFTWTEMVMAYMEFGMVESAVKIFEKMPERNSVSYNALLAGFCKSGLGLRALRMFINMVEDSLEVSESTLSSVLHACDLIMDKRTSEQIHGFIVKFGFELNECIAAALLDMCTRCNRMVDAEIMFRIWEFDKGNPLVWTSMICGYARDGRAEEAISLFRRSQLEVSMVVDEIASTSVLGVCGTLGFRDVGEQIHCHAIKNGFLSDIELGNAIISMYSKCWDMCSAKKVFDSMVSHDVVSWNALMGGHILHRRGGDALALWSDMKKTEIKPDEVTFLVILTAYKFLDVNMVDDCLKLFSLMKAIYNIEPTSDHYATLLGVLGYWGLLKEAEEMIHKMPFPPSDSVWRALLDSCRIHCNTTIGKRVVKHILETEPQDPSTFILVSNLYSASGRWQCSEIVRQKMREMGLLKHPARSWIVSKNKLHSFYARDKSHPQVNDIYRAVHILIKECLRAGYIPDTSFVLQEVEEHQKNEFLFYHSAKLAATYGILVTPVGKPIQIVKNVLLCGDCHTFMKYVSVITHRKILLRDTSGIHHFCSGQCSCKDQW